MTMLKSQPPAAMSKRASVAQTINELMKTFSKSAGKNAEANSEPGDFEGETTHPVKDVDDGTRPATTGARYQENSAQVKEEQGSVGVESVGAPPSQDSQQPNMGTHQALTGEDPSVETSSTKPGKEDGDFEGASTHPARTDNDALNGGKYAEFRRHQQASAKLGNELLASLLTDDTKSAAPAVQQAAAAGAAAADAKIAAAAVPQATADQIALDAIAATVLHGQKSAVKVARFLDDFFAKANDGANTRPASAVKTAAGGKKKRASDEESSEKKDDDSDEGSEESSDSPPKEKSESGGGGGGGSAPPAGPPSGGEPLPGGDAALAGMLDGGGGAPPADPMAGGMPPMDPAAGGGMPPMDPMAADPAMAGGMPPMDPAAGGGMPPGDPMAGGNPLEGLSPEDLQMLLQLLQQEQPAIAGAGAKMASHGRSTIAQNAKRAALLGVIREICGKHR